jgi:hypothetical protein
VSTSFKEPLDFFVSLLKFSKAKKNPMVRNYLQLNINKLARWRLEHASLLKTKPKKFNMICPKFGMVALEKTDPGTQE